MQISSPVAVCAVILATAGAPSALLAQPATTPTPPTTDYCVFHNELYSFG
jgi:hypothetical protein